MPLINLSDPNQCVGFYEAVKLGLGRQQGLFFSPPSQWLPVAVDELLAMPFVERSGEILSALTGGELTADEMTRLTRQAFDFDAPLVRINPSVCCLELFHGPTLAFKDFGARFMAQALALAKRQSNDERPTTIVTATSGDTGAAVAAAFFKQPNVRVVVLYPNNKVSPLQARLFTTLGENVSSIAIDGDFDDCQALVKRLFDDPVMVEKLNINSANSINISRLFAQVCYYFEAWSQLPEAQRSSTSIVVPSGNFGNVCAALMAIQLGLPAKRVIAATNCNDTVPRYMQDKHWAPRPTRQTLSNAMDISAPNNWPRIEALFDANPALRERFCAVAISEQTTEHAMREMYQQGYLGEPHTAVAWAAFEQLKQDDEQAVIIGTAHPAKFAERVEQIVAAPVELPERLLQVLQVPEKQHRMAPDYEQLCEFLCNS